MGYTMQQFKETVTEVNKLKEKEKLLIQKFEESTCELEKCFHYILQSALDGQNHCCLVINTCPELYARALREMGFTVEEMRNSANTLCGYDIHWD